VSVCVRSADSRTNWRDGQVTATTARLLQVFRAAQLLDERMRQVRRGVYEAEPADVLALRVAVSQAAAAIRMKGVSR